MVGLMALVQRRVLGHADVRLQPEIEWWGDGPVPEVFTEPLAAEDLDSRAVF